MAQIPIVSSSMASNSETMGSSNATKLKRNSEDVGWEYGILSNPMNQDKWKCLKCRKEYSGGVYRIKLHIAGIKGNIASCPMASIEDKRRCKEALEEAKKKKTIKKDDNESQSFISCKNKNSIVKK